MNILVTGGAGFIGSHFVELATCQGHEVVVLDALTYAGSPKNLADLPKCYSMLGYSITEPMLGFWMADKGFDAVVNFAAETHVDNSIADSEPFIMTNVLGTRNLLEAARKSRSRPRFVQISTDEVYGSVVDGAFHEKSPLRPSNPYSASKAGADMLCLAYHTTYKMDVVITRCSNNYGPRQHPEKLIPKCIERLQCGRKIQIYGNGLQSRDWIYVVDHCHGIMEALQHGRSGEVYNFGGDNCLTNREVAERIVREFTGTSDFDSHIEHVGDRPGHDVAYKMDFTKSSTELGWHPTTSFSRALSDLIGKAKTGARM